MITLNLNAPQGIILTIFPDGQPHVSIDPNLIRFIKDQEVTVVCSITNSINLVQLLELSNALERVFAKKTCLVIPYLMGSRSDRTMNEGESFDLQVIANLINMCGFKKVFLFDVHSDVSTALIKNSKNESNAYLLHGNIKDNSILICPDAGAMKKAENYLSCNKSLTEVVYCIKHRNDDGVVKVKVLEAEKCNNRNCVIIDDICDGGNTFIRIAEQISPKHLTLIVTHGVFSQGFVELEKYFQQIVVSDSYANSYKSSIVKILPKNW